MTLRAVGLTRDPRNVCAACQRPGGVIELHVICECPAARHDLIACRCGAATHNADHVVNRAVVADALKLARRLTDRRAFSSAPWEHPA